MTHPDGVTASGRHWPPPRVRLDDVFDHAPTGLVVTDPEGVVLTANRSLADLAGTTVEGLVGRTLHDLVDGSGSEDVSRVLDSLRTGPVARVAVHLRAASGPPTPVELELAWIGDPRTSRCLVGHVEDRTEQLALTDALRHAAVHDPLTGLPTRALLLDRLLHACERHSRDGGPVSALFVDLDDFKQVNDRLGHAAGDEVLSTAARLLVAHVRPGDTVARVGGDEFAVLCDDADESTAATVARRLRTALHRTLHLPGGSVELRASVGVATSSGPAVGDPLLLLDRADRDMYARKARTSPRDPLDDS